MEIIFYEIFDELPRQGPGDAVSTEKAFRMLNNLPASPTILDIGCGSGMQTFILAGLIKGKITALDNHPFFIETVNARAKRTGLSGRVTGIVGDMGKMDFPPEGFDIIWSEGAIFIIGLQKGLKEWRKLLKPEGFLVISELAWLKKRKPAEIKNFFNAVYSDIKYYQDVITMIESSGYKLIGSFPIPEESWWQDYYTPAERRISELRKKYPNNKEAKELFDSFLLEIDMFRKYSKYYGNCFYVIQKTGRK
ncbi:MAG: class I SAM-dependent methyltransferase [Dehalococcoidales bacterium]|nr:class I SAM-dependent methyltransferase [Dehalococcoidales bacterium]